MGAEQRERTLPVTFVSRSEGLTVSQVQGIALDDGGILWGSTASGLMRYTGSAVTVLGIEDGLTSHGLRSIAADDHGNLWVGGDAGVDVRRPDGTIERSQTAARPWRWGLADLIVDIVDTGNTLRANGMEPLEEIAAISSRLVVNKAAMRSRHRAIQGVVDDLTTIVRGQSS